MPAAAGLHAAALGEPGQQVSLSQYQGKPVIVNFWASWCAPCQQETPLLASWYKQQHGHVVTARARRERHHGGRAQVRARQGRQLPDRVRPAADRGRAYNVDALPQTFFLNAQHRIVDHVSAR